MTTLLKNLAVKFTNPLKAFQLLIIFLIDSLGGVLRNGQLVWVANGPNLDIFCTKNNSRVSSYTFEHHLK